MYTGELFKKSLAYAKSLHPRQIYILSAKYGLLKLSDMIEPYNKTLNGANVKEQKKWALKVYRQMLDEGINFDEEAIFLCGVNYRK